MRRSIPLALALLVPAAGTAHARPSTLDMTCGEAAATIASYGAVVLSTGQHTYDRFVAHQGHCEPNELAQPALAPTRDAPSCNVGYTCQKRFNDDN